MISVVINTLNEEKNIILALKSVSWADEIVIVDDGSTDETIKKAKLTADNVKLKIFKHKSKGYVEPARNFAIGKATGDWILILDADEEVPETLANRLKEIAEKMKQINFVEIPRKNIIFGKWMKASMWWPDLNIRFFKKGAVKWSDKIHSIPETSGIGIKLDGDEWALLHHNYSSVYQFMERLNRYTSIQAKELANDGLKFKWNDLIEKPLSEFLSRFFANKGYQDGLHGLALSLLQSLSFLVVYIKLWEFEKFKEQELTLNEINESTKKSGQDIEFWIKAATLSKNPLKRMIQKIGNRFS